MFEIYQSLIPQPIVSERSHHVFLTRDGEGSHAELTTFV